MQGLLISKSASVGYIRLNLDYEVWYNINNGFEMENKTILKQAFFVFNKFS